MNLLVRLLCACVVAFLLPLVSGSTAHAEEIDRSTAPTTYSKRTIPRGATIKVTVNNHGSKILSRSTTLWRDGSRVYDWSPKPGTYKVKSVIRWQQVVTNEDYVWVPDEYCSDYSYDGYDACAEGGEGYYDYQTSKTLAGKYTATRYNTVTVSTNATPGCVSGTEFRAIKDGMTMSRVHYIFGTSGWVTNRGSGGIGREYETCAGDPDWSYADVDYEWRNGAYRVWFKWLYISS